MNECYVSVNELSICELSDCVLFQLTCCVIYDVYEPKDLLR